MKPVHIHHGDSREVIKGLADNSIDSVVCDPPYALVSIVKRFGGPNAAAAKSEGASGVYKRASAGFMGQAWDTGETAFDPEFWADVLRVLKPGGHVVAASGTRTYHRLACAIEDAGFEVRDMVSWLYGSGFPKSHDVSKGIDKHGGASIGWFGPWLRAERERRGITQKSLAAHFPSRTGNLTGCVANWELGLNSPTPEQFNLLCRILDLPFDEIAEAEREVIGEASASRLAVAPGQINDRSATILKITAPSSPEAAQWSGWGTALKPACEPWVLARKPMAGTVAANVLAHGTGALNIDATRIGETDGRWPANVVHDGSDEVIDAFPASAGQQGDVRGTEPSKPTNGIYGDFAGRPAQPRRGDEGSAARFFYSAKADPDDRMGSKHPTVKPIDLMRWLCRLVTPTGGLVLDPFAGSGSTGVAAMLEGFESILIEREAQYVADIRRKVDFYRGEGRLAIQEKGKVGAESIDSLPLFGGEAA